MHENGQDNDVELAALQPSLSFPFEAVDSNIVRFLKHRLWRNQCYDSCSECNINLQRHTTVFILPA